MNQLLSYLWKNEKYPNRFSEELYWILVASLDMCCLENEAELRTDLAAPTLTITELSLWWWWGYKISSQNVRAPQKVGCEVTVLKVTRIDEHSVIRLWLTFKFLHWQKTRKSFVTCCIKLQLECWSGDIVPNPYPVFLSGSRNPGMPPVSVWVVLTCLPRPRVLTFQSQSLGVLPRVNVNFAMCLCVRMRL